MSSVYVKLAERTDAYSVGVFDENIGIALYRRLAAGIDVNPESVLGGGCAYQHAAAAKYRLSPAFDLNTGLAGDIAGFQQKKTAVQHGDCGIRIVHRLVDFAAGEGYNPICGNGDDRAGCARVLIVIVLPTTVVSNTSSPPAGIVMLAVKTIVPPVVL